MKPHYGSHANDLNVPPSENGDCETMKVLLNCFACYKQSYWQKKVTTVFIISLYSLWFDLTRAWTHKISICCFSAKHTANRSKRKDC